MHQLYPAILERFEDKKEWFTRNGLLPIATIDMYMEQPVKPNEFEFILPAIFIDYNIDWNEGIITVDAHCLSEYLEDTENFAANITSGLNYVKSIAVVRHIITNTKTDFISCLKPQGERPATTDYFHYQILSFKANIEDYIDNELIPAPMTDTEITGVLTRHDLKQKAPESGAPLIDLDMYKE